MRIRTRITTEARARGFTALELAQHLGWYRSNISAMDAGRRSISMRTLARISQVLGCSPSDLLDASATAQGSLFRKRQLNARLAERDLGTPDGIEKGWVHRTQLAWRRHYGTGQKAA